MPAQQGHAADGTGPRVRSEVGRRRERAHRWTYHEQGDKPCPCSRLTARAGVDARTPQALGDAGKLGVPRP
jgi:hypothetical protein